MDVWHPPNNASTPQEPVWWRGALGCRYHNYFPQGWVCRRRRHMDGVWLGSPAAEITPLQPWWLSHRPRRWLADWNWLGAGEILFELMESFCDRWCPGQRFGLVFQEASERTGDGAVIMDEPPVEDWEAEKALEFFDGCGDGPVLNGGYLPLVHLDATEVNVVSKELHWGLVE